MAIENGAFVGLIDPTIPSNNDPRAEGAAQIRAVKQAIIGSFPNIDARVNATAAEMNNVFDNSLFVPMGAIMMWEDMSNIPAGWSPCDGGTYNGVATPNLVNRFLKGWDGTTTLQTGGSNSVNLATLLSVDGHKLTVGELPSHDHPLQFIYNGNPDGSGDRNGSGRYEYLLDPRSNGLTGGGGITDTYAKSTGGNLTHKHGLSSVANLNNQPAYTTIGYIKYTGDNL